ncbi:hypothetical protein [Bosea sp. NPDC055594]
MAKPPRPHPEPGERISLDVLNETAVGMRMHVEPQGALMDNWTACYNRDEQAAPSDEHVGKLCIIRTKDGRNLTMRVYRSYSAGNWSLLSVGGSVEENVGIEWVAPIRLVLPR